MDYRLPATVVPSRYDLRLEPDLEAATFAGEETMRSPSRRSRSRRSCSTRPSSPSSQRASRTRRACRSRGASTLDEAAERARLSSRGRSRRGAAATPPLHGHPQRSPPRLLPQHVQGRRGRRPHHRRHPVRGDRRAAGFPCWDEPGVQGGLRRDAGGARGPRRDLEHAVVSEAPPGAGDERWPSRTASACRPISWPSWSASSRRRRR